MKQSLNLSLHREIQSYVQNLATALQDQKGNVAINSDGIRACKVDNRVFISRKDILMYYNIGKLDMPILDTDFFKNILIDDKSLIEYAKNCKNLNSFRSFQRDNQSERPKKVEKIIVQNRNSKPSFFGDEIESIWSRKREAIDLQKMKQITRRDKKLQSVEKVIRESTSPDIPGTNRIVFSNPVTINFGEERTEYYQPTEESSNDDLNEVASNSINGQDLTVTGIVNSESAEVQYNTISTHETPRTTVLAGKSTGSTFFTTSENAAKYAEQIQKMQSLEEQLRKDLQQAIMFGGHPSPDKFNARNVQEKAKTKLPSTMNEYVREYLTRSLKKDDGTTL